MKTTVVLLGIALFALGACSTSPEVEPTPEPTSQVARAEKMDMKAMMQKMCPMEVAGTTVEAVETPTGVAMDFKTSSDVEELQDRVTSMAAKMEAMHSGKGEGMHGGKMAHSAPAHSAKVEMLESGARLNIEPKDPAELSALREHVKKRAEMMASGKCPMMKEGMPASQPGSEPSGDHSEHH